MFGIGSTELIVIFVVALLVLGPKSLPGIAKTLGKVMGEFRRVTTEFQRTMNAEVAQEEHEKRKKEAEEELFGKNSEGEGDKVSNVEPKSNLEKKVTKESDIKNDSTNVAAQDIIIDAQASPLNAAIAKTHAEAHADIPKDTSPNVNQKVDPNMELTDKKG